MTRPSPATSLAPPVSRWTSLVYGAGVYALFLGTFVLATCATR